LADTGIFFCAEVEIKISVEPVNGGHIIGFAGSANVHKILLPALVQFY
jgi:hypothetical protein